jgi:hypothetical protein
LLTVRRRLEEYSTDGEEVSLLIDKQRLRREMKP